MSEEGLECSYKIYNGVPDAMELISKLYNHVVQAIDIPVGGGEGDQSLHQVYWRSKGC